MEILAGWLTIIAAITCAVPAVIWWGILEERRQFTNDMEALDHDDTIDINSTADTQVITGEVLIVDTRPVNDTPRPVVDELGEWKPWEHTQEQPMLLGHVLTTKRWDSMNALEMGLVVSA